MEKKNSKKIKPEAYTAAAFLEKKNCRRCIRLQNPETVAAHLQSHSASSIAGANASTTWRGRRQQQQHERTQKEAADDNKGVAVCVSRAPLPPHRHLHLSFRET